MIWTATDPSASMAKRTSAPYRVIQWATGKLGTEALRQIIDHPDLELIGVHVYSADKKGIDAGDLCGRGRTGVRATNDIATTLATDADVVLYMPMLEPTTEKSDREVLALLESGKSVISIRGYYWPRWRGAEYEQKFLDACAKGRSTLHGNGICPGFVFDRMGPAVTSFCTAVREVNFIEYFDLRMRPAHTIYDVIGLGHPPGVITLDHQTPRTLTTLYSEMYHLMAAQWETEVVSIDLALQWVPADRDIMIKAGLIAKGTARGAVWTWTIRMANSLVVTQKSHWYVDPIDGWDQRNVWIIDVVGEPHFRAEMPLEAVGPDALTQGGYDPNGRAIAALCINAIPEVVAAPPGILKPTIFAPWRARFR
jgi:2,4-diaminopentanoate dehydrogenase